MENVPVFQAIKRSISIFLRLDETVVLVKWKFKFFHDKNPYEPTTFVVPWRTRRFWRRPQLRGKNLSGCCGPSAMSSLQDLLEHIG